jgi:hypothetical protein
MLTLERRCKMPKSIPGRTTVRQVDCNAGMVPGAPSRLSNYWVLWIVQTLVARSSYLFPGDHNYSLQWFSNNSFGQVRNESKCWREEVEAEEWLAYFTLECVEDPLHHCITADDAYISIAANNLCGGEQYEGRWIPKEGLELNRDAAPRPHFTRIQPQDCRYQILNFTLIDAWYLWTMNTSKMTRSIGTKTRHGLLRSSVFNWMLTLRSSTSTGRQDSIDILFMLL